MVAGEAMLAEAEVAADSVGVVGLWAGTTQGLWAGTTPEPWADITRERSAGTTRAWQQVVSGPVDSLSRPQ
jgi:hypothetical protein